MAERYEAQRSGDGWRVTDTRTDSRIATSYSEENARFVVQCLNTATAMPARASGDFIGDVQRAAVIRANRWHAGDFRQWSVLEWAGAMCGEAGEAANVAKKLRRAELSLDGNRQSERPAETDALRALLSRECADVFLYLVLLAACYEIDLTTAIVYTFNAKSIEMGFPERIAAPAQMLCPKVPHDDPRGGYLHGADVDSPYSVDGMLYCGRCHYSVSETTRRCENPEASRAHAS